MPEGKIVLNVEFTIDMDEMGRWPPQTITKFFEGLATMLYARESARIRLLPPGVRR
jgi:hypothetical protein